jgi:hypothetical protein
MNLSLRWTAMGLAVLSIGWQDADTQAPTATVPTKQLPQAQTSRLPSTDVEVNRTSQDVTSQAEPAASPLEELAWMVGDWVDQDDDATIESSVNWTKNRKFLTRSFRVTPKNGTLHSGMQSKAGRPVQGMVDQKSQRAVLKFADGQNTDLLLERGSTT